MTKSYSPKLGEQLGGRLSPGMHRTLGEADQLLLLRSSLIRPSTMSVCVSRSAGRFVLCYCTVNGPHYAHAYESLHPAAAALRCCTRICLALRPTERERLHKLDCSARITLQIPPSISNIRKSTCCSLESGSELSLASHFIHKSP